MKPVSFYPIPDSDTLYGLHDTLTTHVGQLRVRAEKLGSRRAWEAAIALEATLAPVWSAAGCLALDETELDAAATTQPQISSNDMHEDPQP